MLGWLRRTLRLDDPKQWGAVFGWSTASGEPMTEAGALALSTAWACIRLRSRVIGTLPVQVFRQGSDGAPEPARDHWLYPILARKPNQVFTAARFWQSAIAALDCNGNAYLEKMIGSNDRRVVGLEWLYPALMDVQLRDGVWQYWYSDPISGKRRRVMPDRVVHCRQFSGGHFVGRSAIAYGARSLGLARDTQRAASASFGQGLRPGGFFKSPRVLEQPQRADFKKAFIEDKQGPDNAGWIGLLEGGFEWQEVSIKATDAQMLESRRFDVEEICRWFDVPPIMIGHASEGQTMWGTGVEQLVLQWLTTSVAPMCVDLEQQLANDLLTMEDIGSGVFIRFNIDALLRATAADRAQFLSTVVGAGIYTRNEARKKENLPPKPGGDVLTVQQQMVPLAGIEQRQPAPAIPPRPAPDREAA